MGVGTKLTLMGLGAVVLATTLMAIVGVRQSNISTQQASEKIKAGIEDGLRGTAAGTLDMVKCQDQSVGSKAAGSKALRQLIMQRAVGKSGYIWVLGGEGAGTGRYIISKGGERDGENIWDTKDANGKLCIQEMVNGAKALKPGDTLIYRYSWLNPGETAPRQKIAAVTYYKPWKWVIGAACYEDELYTLADLQANKRNLIIWILAAALVSMAAGGLTIRYFAQRISRQLGQLTQVADALSLGDVDTAGEIISERAA